ncbi:MAG: ABC-F family ATP-binding cassette domain-containing protein [Candidatus Kapaibacterium sp.]
MLAISHLSIHFGGHYLFDDISFTIGTRDRIGLVGKNGAGKSTLLKILAREQSPETGVVSQPNNFIVGYLSQDIEARLGKTVYEETKTALAELVELERKIHEYSDQLATRTDYESDAYSDLLHKLGEANEYFEFHGGYTMEGDIQRILTGLGFVERDLDRLVDEFSGGWQMRIELAKILLRKPDCILLDEPTNHLDIESIQWLEEYLRTYEGSVVLVSHDRTFLDTVTNRTIEITNANIEDYPTSYSRYVVLRQERRDQNLAAYTNQQKEIAKTEAFIERFRSKANLASRVQSRVKALDKIDRIELEEEDLSTIRFRFPPAPRSGSVVVETEHLVKSYGEKVILNGLDFGLDRGDRVAFVGKNGEGKTTFSKILVGLEEYQAGQLKLGHNVRIGYYAQHQAESLDGNATVFEIIDNAATGEMRTRIRSLLGAFLFSGDAVFKKVKVLSGGEKSRLALAKLLLEPINFLVLDEPTNHLDMRAKDVLKQSLMDYDGAMIVVSHDRDFLQGLTNKVVEFKGGKIREYSGDVYDFLKERQIDSLRELEIKRDIKNNPPKVEVKPVLQSNEYDREDQKRREKEKRSIEKQIIDAETIIATIETAITEFEKKMSATDFYTNQKESASVTQQYQAKRSELDRAMARWTDLLEQLENLG